MTEDLINRITYHLSSGGLFNPELADHLAVRNLLMECRDALAQRTWVGLTEKDICEAAVKSQEGISPRDDTLRFAIAIEAKLKEKNT
jgi:hypothetical protein